MPDVEAIPILEPPANVHRRLVEQHVHALMQRHSDALDVRDDGGALSLDDLTVVHGIDRFSVPTLVALGPAWAPGGSARMSSVGDGLDATARSSARSSLAASRAPDHELANTRARLVGVTRHRAGGHCEFLVQVDTGKEQFVVRRRFSEFRDLRQQLLAALKARQACRGGACASLAEIEAAKFPRRRLRFGLKRSSSTGGAGGDLDTARGRVVLLQRFLDAVLRVYRHAPKRQVRSCLNAQCKLLGDVRAFLDLDMPDGGALSLGDSAGPPFAQSQSQSQSLAASARDLEWRERANSTGSSVTVVSPSVSRDCMRAPLGLARSRSEPAGAMAAAAAVAVAVADAPGDVAKDSRRSQAASARSSLYTITEDLESLHLRAH